MSLPAVVNPHVAALEAMCVEAEMLARELCTAMGWKDPDAKRLSVVPDATPLKFVEVRGWRLFVSQAHGLLNQSRGLPA